MDGLIEASRLFALVTPAVVLVLSIMGRRNEWGFPITQPVFPVLITVASISFLWRLWRTYVIWFRPDISVRAWFDDMSIYFNNLLLAAWCIVGVITVKAIKALRS